jgi:magnesium-transporting ATPase (P-type)
VWYTVCVHALLYTCRAEVDPSEDLEVLNAQAILARKPFLAMVMMVAILDPPREEAVRAVRMAHSAGITVKMITGMYACRLLQAR